MVAGKLNEIKLLIRHAIAPYRRSFLLRYLAQRQEVNSHNNNSDNEYPRHNDDTHSKTVPYRKRQYIQMLTNSLIYHIEDFSYTLLYIAQGAAVMYLFVL